MRAGGGRGLGAPRGLRGVGGSGREGAGGEGGPAASRGRRAAGAPRAPGPCGAPAHLSQVRRRGAGRAAAAPSPRAGGRRRLTAEPPGKLRAVSKFVLIVFRERQSWVPGLGGQSNPERLPPAGLGEWVGKGGTGCGAGPRGPTKGEAPHPGPLPGPARAAGSSRPTASASRAASAACAARALSDSCVPLSPLMPCVSHAPPPAPGGDTAVRSAAAARVPCRAVLGSGEIKVLSCQVVLSDRVD